MSGEKKKEKRIALFLSIWLPILTLGTLLAMCSEYCSTPRLVARKKVIAGKERVEDGVVLLVSVLVAAQSHVMVLCGMSWSYSGRVICM